MIKNKCVLCLIPIYFQSITMCIICKFTHLLSVFTLCQIKFWFGKQLKLIRSKRINIRCLRVLGKRVKSQFSHKVSTNDIDTSATEEISFMKFHFSNILNINVAQTNNAFTEKNRTFVAKLELVHLMIVWNFWFDELFCLMNVDGLGSIFDRRDSWSFSLEVTDTHLTSILRL